MARLAAVGCLLGAAAIHASQVRTHFSEWRMAGYAFVLIAALEAILAFALALTVSRRVVRMAIALNIATVLLWAFSRTVGIPWGPHAGEPEPVGRVDLTSKALEVFTLVALVPLLSRRPPSVGARATAATYVALAILVGGISLPTWFALQPSGDCGPHEMNESGTGPLAPIDGHSLLPRDTPVVRAHVGREGGLVVGLLRNCGDRPLEVHSARIISESNFDGAIAARTFWVVPSEIAGPGTFLGASELRRLGVPLPGDAFIRPVAESHEMPGLVLVVSTLRPGEYSLDGVEVSYSLGDESYAAPFADIARVAVVAAGTPRGK